MTMKFMLFAIALAVGISACNDSSLPTDGGRDLLNDPSNARSMGDSKYGRILDDPGSEPGEGTEDTVDVSGAIELPDTVTEPDTVDVSEAAAEPAPGSYHITDGPKRSQYSDIPVYHYTDGPLKSAYGLTKWYHVTDGPSKSNYRNVKLYHITAGPLKSLYIDKQTSHITTGPKKSQYNKPAPVTPGTGSGSGAGSSSNGGGM